MKLQVPERLDNETALHFLRQHSSRPLKSVTTVVYSWGIFTGEKLEAVAQFCYPREDRARLTHTGELLQWAIRDGTGIDAIEAVVDFVTYYQSLTRAADLWISAEVVAGAPLEPLGFTRCGEEAKDEFYSWINPALTFYTYKITATDSEKYYFGVSHVKKEQATLEDCLNDGYYGSGGQGNPTNKFNSWKQKHQAFLCKEIMGVHLSKAPAYLEEKVLVGDRWLHDPNCLNSVGGGGGPTQTDRKFPTHHFDVCSIHGRTAFIGTVCRRCCMASIFSAKHCEIHGLTSHVGNACHKCSRGKAMQLRNCPAHGETMHLSSACFTCIAQKAISRGTCSLHGEVTFQGAKCVQCEIVKKTSLRQCPIHGESKHYGETCCKCTSSKRVSAGECADHGLVTLLDGVCSACTNQERVTLQNCHVHGEVTHQGETCTHCAMARTINERECSVHGWVKHHGTTCSTCSVEQTVSIKLCAIHGAVKHQGDTCSSCSNLSLISMKTCSLHGHTKHRGESCMKCVGEKRTTLKECSTHGLTKHLGDTCARCAFGKKDVLKTCEFHGEAPHKGNSCRKCINEKISHSRSHKTPQVDCRHCNAT